MDLPIANPVAVFAVLALLLLIVPLLAARVRVPAIVALILCGTVIGPKGLNLVARGGGVELLGSVGLLYIMFIAGLEIDLIQFRKHRRTAFGFGMLTFLIPQLVGSILGRALLGMGWPSAILLGSLFASHTLLPYAQVSRLGLARDPAVTATVGGTMITDCLALLVLAVIARLHAGSLDLQYGLRLLLGIGGLVLASVWLLPRLGRWFYRNLAAEDAPEFLFLFASLLVVALLSEAAGLEAIIGAFLAGLALNSLVPEQSRLMNRVQFIGNTLFIPFFLLAVGMLVDVRVFRAGAAAWLVAGTMVATVLATKYAAARGTQWAFNFSREQGVLVFGLSVNQAAATLAAVLVGHRLGLLDDAVLNGTILMILVSCLIGPWATDWAARRLALAKPLPGAGHAGHRPQRILVPLANPATAAPLMDLAFMLRDRHSAQPIHPLSVVSDSGDLDAELARSEKILSQAVVHAAAADVPVRAETRVDPEIAAAIVRAAKELRATCLLIGWNSGTAFAPQVVFGRILDRVLLESPEMLLVCRLGHPVATLKRLVLLVPPLAIRMAGFAEVLRTAVTLVRQGGLHLTIVGLAPDLPGVRRHVKVEGPERPRLVTLEVWSQLWKELAKLQLGENDLLFLVSCRKGSLAWLPGTDRLPQRLARTAPAAGVVVAYPPETPAGAGEEAPAIPAGFPVQPENLRLGLAAPTAQEAITEMLGDFLASRGGNWRGADGAATDAAGLAAKLAAGTLEITPGVVLMHTHGEGLAEPVVLLGVAQHELEFPDLANPAYAIFVLLSPAALPPERHLQALADIAKLVLAAPAFDRIRQATSPAEVPTLLAPATTGLTRRNYVIRP
ncbi:MAG: cation:proton antiporter [Lentisphaeria bacterium]|jgi:Kef-type K+ transport system membrane component KefB/mannitol/fructose-specific phosphotransferase system IIA component (Ntr-type)